MNTRKMIYEADEMFPNRWSPRKFSDKKVDKEDLLKMIEAARWAPSCYNAQPALFYCAESEGSKAKVLDSLVIPNQKWAVNASFLMYITAQKQFEFNGKDNWWSRFDAGSAWMSFAIQGRKLGIATHAMAGFDKEKAYEVTGFDKDKIEIIAALAVGYPEEPPTEFPNDRKPTNEFVNFH